LLGEISKIKDCVKGKMPERYRKNQNQDELDDDDEDGSKAEDGDYEDVKDFDEEDDLGIKKTTPHTVAGAVTKPTTASSYPMTMRGSGTKKGSHAPSNLSGGDLDTKEMLTLVERITTIPWPAAAGKRPPRDMKRLDGEEWYVVCKVMKWGDTPALFVRATRKAAEDFGFYKPPAQYYTYHFQVGDRLQLSRVGYSSSRNKVAVSISVKATHMFPVPETKQNWVAPPIPETATVPADHKVLRKKEKASRREQYDDDDDNDDEDEPPRQRATMPKKKRMKEVMVPNGMIGRNPTDEQHLIHHQLTHSPYGIGPQHGKSKKELSQMMFPQHTFPNPVNVQQNLSASGYFGFSGTPDLHMQRAGSFSLYMSMPDIFGGLPPSSPNLLGSSSPMMGNGPSMHRIASTGAFPSFSSISSPTNCPPFTTSYTFPTNPGVMNYSAPTDAASGN
jgi:hypothetical protein